MKKSILITFLLISSPLLAQQVSTIDFMKVVDGNRNELIYYYENNWKVLRDMALDRDYIVSYELLETEADSTGDFDILLITRYKDEEAYGKAEERFQGLIKEIQTDGGPKLMNNLTPLQFRDWKFSKTTKTVFSGS